MSCKDKKRELYKPFLAFMDLLFFINKIYYVGKTIKPLSNSISFHYVIYNLCSNTAPIRDGLESNF